MKYVLVRFFSLLFFLLLIPGCGRLVDWGKETFYQGKTVSVDRSIAQEHIRSVAVYDQFSTSGIFDALLLSDEVRTLYAQMCAQKLGKNQDQFNAFLRRQLEENKHYLSFYVLSAYEKPLGDITSEWVIFLRINGEDRVPAEVKSIDMPSEYQLLFGKRFNRFKVAYSVKFEKYDRDDNLVISPDIHQIALVFRSLSKEAVLTWEI